jgi:phage terminase large subunit-like protein
VLTEDARGARLGKHRRHSTRRIDLAVCLVMAHARATFHAANPRPNRTVSFL